MFIVILFIFLGILSGVLCRKLSTGARISLTDVAARWQGRIVTWLIWLLLFLLGIEVGSNEMIVRSLPTLGVEALLLSSAATLGCCVLAWMLWRVSKNNTVQENAKNETSADKEGNPAEKEGLQGSSLIRGLKVMKGSLIVVGFFVIGLLGGIEKMVPLWLLDGDVSFVALCGLLLFVGLGIGLNPEMKKEVRSLSPRMALLPVVTIIGSWLGALLIWTELHRTLSDCMAINSGFAYYSLSSIFITEYRGAELGTIALLANIIREMLTLLGAPLMAHWFGPLASISAGGATTMDTTLPILSQTVGQRYIALSIYHGFVVDFTVPFLVSWWCMV
nr:lysine exporter LysO family protein [uncultured Prevotella sp.]